MENCKYKEIGNGVESEKFTKKSVQWRPFLKQLVVCSGVWTSIFMYGLGVGAPTVFIPQIRRETNSSNVITDDMASWISSVYSFSGFPFVIVLSITTSFFGRKIPFIIAAVDSLLAFTVLYNSSNVTHILISSIMQGFLSATQIVVSIMVITEYTSPEYRGIFLIIKSATFYWGIWVSNAIGTFFYWKIIPLIGIACTIYTIFTALTWPESPYWLASKGKFEECAASHRWLKGCSEESENELKILINLHKEHKDIGKLYEGKNCVVDFLKTIKSREFYKPTVIAFVTGSLSVFCGKLVCAVYALDILKSVTNNETTAYVGMLILDGVTVFSMYLGCILANKLSRRILLLVTSVVGVIFLFVLSIYLYLIKLDVIFGHWYVTIFLMLVFSIAVSCGPLTMSISVYGELIPIKSRNLSVCFVALLGKLVIAILLKTSPLIVRECGLHGLFLFFGISSLMLLLVISKYLPETKDKTLQEISDMILK